MRSESLLQYLRGRYDVEIAAFTLPEHSKSASARFVRNAGRLLRGVPPLFDRFSHFDGQVGRDHYDLVVVEHFWCAGHAKWLGKLCNRLVLDLHNIESELARSHAESLRWPERWVHQRFAAMYRQLERKWLPEFDTILVTSEADRARVPHPDVRVFPNAIPEVPIPEVPERDTIVFSGNLEYHPNIEAVRWFCSSIWPRILEQAPEAEWRLVGRNPEAIEGIVRNSPRTHVTGPVDDAIAALAAARVCVVPLLSGSGTRFKILEAWAAQRAVVSTSIGAEGLGARHGEHLLIVDRPREFADAVLRLWKDKSLRNKLASAGRALYTEHFTWRAAWDALEASGGI